MLCVHVCVCARLCVCTRRDCMGLCRSVCVCVCVCFAAVLNTSSSLEPVWVFPCFLASRWWTMWIKPLKTGAQWGYNLCPALLLLCWGKLFPFICIPAEMRKHRQTSQTKHRRHQQQHTSGPTCCRKPPHQGGGTSILPDLTSGFIPSFQSCFLEIWTCFTKLQ